jgi:hypothetical protein
MSPPSSCMLNRSGRCLSTVSGYRAIERNHETQIGTSPAICEPGSYVVNCDSIDMDVAEIESSVAKVERCDLTRQRPLPAYPVVALAILIKDDHAFYASIDRPVRSDPEIHGIEDDVRILKVVVPTSWAIERTSGDYLGGGEPYITSSIPGNPQDWWIFELNFREADFDTTSIVLSTSAMFWRCGSNWNRNNKEH